MESRSVRRGRKIGLKKSRPPTNPMHVRGHARHDAAPASWDIQTLNPRRHIKSTQFDRQAGQLTHASVLAPNSLIYIVNVCIVFTLISTVTVL